MTDPYLYECEITVNENSQFPDVEFHKITNSDDALQHQMIIIRELKAQNEELKTENKMHLEVIRGLKAKNKELEAENKIHLEACMEYKQRLKEEKEHSSYFYHIADDLYNKLKEIQKDINIDVVEKLEDEKQELLKQIAELQQICTEMAVKMHSAINAYEILKQKTGYTDDHNKKESIKETEKKPEEKTE